MKGTYQHGGLGPNSDMDTLVSQAVIKEGSWERFPVTESLTTNALPSPT